ncbi:MAG: DUF1697 domain-containing protein [Chloroflexia bacterium]
MTQRCIALLRAINVGGHTVKMVDLRNLFEALGFSSVETFIASGNVIFDSLVENTEGLEKRIANHLKESLGYEVATFIRSAPEIMEIANYQPFPAEELAAEGVSLYVVFLSALPSEGRQQKLMGYRSPVDDFHIYGREVYWLCRKKMSESAFSGGLLEKTLAMPATIRNSTTVKKLATKYGQVPQS